MDQKSRLTASTFKTLAGMLGRVTAGTGLPDQKVTHIWLQFAVELSQTNPKFNATKFLAAVSDAHNEELARRKEAIS